MFKIKEKKTVTFTLYKYEDKKNSCESYRLADDTGKNVLTTHNMTFMLNFIARLRESGHTVVLDALFCNKNGDTECAGCVLDTGSGCLLEQKEDDKNE